MCIVASVVVCIRAFGLTASIPHPCSNTTNKLTPQGIIFIIDPYWVSISLYEAPWNVLYPFSKLSFT